MKETNRGSDSKVRVAELMKVPFRTGESTNHHNPHTHRASKGLGPTSSYRAQAIATQTLRVMRTERISEAELQEIQTANRTHKMYLRGY